MKILFISGAYAKAREEELKSDSRSGTLQNAPNVFQWAVIDGLAKNKADFEVVSYPFLASFPLGYKKLRTPQERIHHLGKDVGSMESYCPLMILKNISIKRRLRKYVAHWIEENSRDGHERLAVLVYTPISFFLSALAPLKSNHPNLIVSTIVTDLVDDAMNYRTNRSLLKRIQFYFEKKKEKQLYNSIDKFVLLAQAMEEKIPQAGGRSIVVEGIYASAFDEKSAEKSENTVRTLLYTGSLHVFAGIIDLVDAFSSLKNPAYRLVICGSGECAEYIRQKSSEDPRIIFRGMVPRDEVLKLQHAATLLVNPRKPDRQITRFSFPSKTMEYLASGTPMLGYKLEGIPADYYNHYYTLDELSTAALATRIDEVLSLPESALCTKAAGAMNFIKAHKTSETQVQRILKFLEQ